MTIDLSDSNPKLAMGHLAFGVSEQYSILPAIVLLRAGCQSVQLVFGGDLIDEGAKEQFRSEIGMRFAYHGAADERFEVEPIADGSHAGLAEPAFVVTRTVRR